MKDKDIIKTLELLKHIEPRESFSKESRLLIMSSSQKTPLQRMIPTKVSLSGVLSHSFAQHPLRALAFTVAGVALIVTAYTATKEISPLFLPGLNQNKVVAEAEMVNKTINIELQRLEYFDATNKTGSSALNQVTSEELDHLNTSILQKEVGTIDQKVSSSSLDNSELNAQLNTILQQVNE